MTTQAAANNLRLPVGTDVRAASAQRRARANGPVGTRRPQWRPTCSDCGERMPNPASLGFISPKYFQLLFYDLTHMLYGVLLVYFRGVAGTGREHP
ncbi:MAG: hypothetical protein ACREV1_01580 [Gammaproteobacteria bacterium]